MLVKLATLSRAFSCAACVLALLCAAAFAQEKSPKQTARGRASADANVGAQDPFALRAARNRAVKTTPAAPPSAAESDRADGAADAETPSKPKRPAKQTQSRSGADYNDVLRLQDEADAIPCSVVSLSCRSGVVVQTASGERAFALKQVASVELAVSREFESALAAYESGKKLGAFSEYERALELFKTARQNAERKIEKEWATAMIVGVSQALGRDDDAVAEFFLLTTLDPFTAFLPAIPLRWVNQSALDRGSDANVKQLTESAAAQQLDAQGNKNPTSKLLAASVLFNSSRYSKNAIAALQDLVVLEPSPDASQDEQDAVKLIALLATAQLWRATLLKNPSERDLQRWLKTLDLFPRAFRLGPETIVAQAQRKLGQNEQAADAFLKISVLAADRFAVARFTAKEAADAYEEIGRKNDAAKIRGDAAKRFGTRP